MFFRNSLALVTVLALFPTESGDACVVCRGNVKLAVDTKSQPLD